MPTKEELVSVPCRGSSFLYKLTLVAGLHFYSRTFPSPVGEVVSYILPLPDGSVMRQKWAFAAENRFECITTLLSL